MDTTTTTNDTVTFKVNGVEHTVGSDVSSDVMLVDYLRSYLDLRGTKYMCREGGCGACIVTAAKTSSSPHVAINSCLIAIASCHGWDIRTIEGLGNRKDGYHKLQSTMAENHATQCGYCTPGWIMSMHGLMESKKDLTMLEIEKSFGSNLCRCTGYRPILQALKKFAKDAPASERIMNIEDLSICKPGGCCQKPSFDTEDWCMVRQDDYREEKMKKIVFKDGKKWYRPTNLQEVLDLLLEDSESYMLVAGNTSKGAFPIDAYPNTLIDISCIQALKANDFDQNLIVGAGLTLAEFMDVLKTGANQEYFSYLSDMYDHMDLVAHIPLRNVATIAGNLMIKHMYNSFQSDIYLLLNTIGAQLTIVSCNGTKQVVTMEYFLKVDMKGKVILNVLLPPLSDQHKLVTYKVMARAQSCHAVVNAAFLYKLDCNNEVLEAKIIYGALSVNFTRATATETYLVGKSLFSNDTLQGALRVLDGEMIVDDHLPEPSVEYRRYLAKALFFKSLLKLCPSRGSRMNSAVVDLHKTRPCSSSKQTFTTDSTLWPMNKPICKLEATIQCAGEAQYTDDTPSVHNEVFGAFVLSSIASGTITKMDASRAMALDGVIAFYTAKDIPGLNSFTPADGPFTVANEEVLCGGTVKYHCQPIGIIVADDQHVAERAAKLVEVTYCNITTPVVDIEEARKDSSRTTLFASIDATSTGTDVYKTITGTNVLRGQYHFHMETMVCLANPTEEGLKVRLSSQWLHGTHVMISRALNIPLNKIDVHIGCVGGSYGMKITRSIQSAVACSLVAYKLNRPCRFIQLLKTNLTAFGKRLPNVAEYECAVNSSGVMQYLNTNIYMDNGYKVNEPVGAYCADVYNNCYDAAQISFKIYDCITDTAKNTFCRSPGTLEAIANIEMIMERISYELSLDPLAVRLANLDKTNFGEMETILESLKTSSEYTTRRAAVDSFNTQNRWKKRGLRFAFSRWSPVGGMYLDVNLAVYEDGSIVITHGGIEMGQGLNTKVAQVAAHFLNVSLDKIQIKHSNTIIAPNTSVTGGSISADCIIIALKKSVEQLTTRLEPVKTTLTDPTWEQLVTAAYAAGVDLQVHGFVSTADAQSYNIFGMAVAEVEVDVLTGQFEILRVDIMQDVGVSISPEIDIGQIEGGFVMALGYWTCEKLVCDSESGANLSDRSWDYHLPEARDIPQDFRVSFLKNSYSNSVILGSKAVGEPATCSGVVIPLALREAITHARQESGIPSSEWFHIDGPYSIGNICMAMKNNTEDFKLY